jgi:predicted transposase/invertase (TIGR01784 family)
MTIIELDKLGDILDKSTDDMTPLEMWLIFLRYADDVKKRDLVNEILRGRGEITMAANVLSSISQEEHMRAKRMSQRKYETDMANNYLEGIDVGRAEGEAKGEARGIKKGKAEKAKDIAKKLKTLAVLPNKQIAEISGLSIAEIEKL